MAKRRVAFHLAEGFDINSVVRELERKLDSTPALTIVFASTNIPDSQSDVVRAIRSRVGGEIWGCSTAGEISSTGFHKNSIVALSIEARDTVFNVNTEVEMFGDDPVSSGSAVTRRAFKNLRSTMDIFLLKFLLRSEKTDALEMLRALSFNMLITMDGLPGVEEKVLKGIARETLNKIGSAGGSAGDDLKFTGTYVYSKFGAFSNAVSVAAIYTILRTGVGIKIGFVPDTSPFKRGVVTSNGETQRIVKTINNKPAVDVYMKWLGVNTIEDANKSFAENPLGVVEPSSKIWKVRSPAKILDDGSMLFYSDLPEGVGVSLLRSNRELHVRAVREAVKDAIRRAGNPEKIGAVILFDCILRDILSDIYSTKQYEIEQVKSIVGNDVPIIGFSTYGETGNSDLMPLWHHNQTITAMVISDFPRTFLGKA